MHLLDLEASLLVPLGDLPVGVMGARRICFVEERERGERVYRRYRNYLDLRGLKAGGDGLGRERI